MTTATSTACSVCGAPCRDGYELTTHEASCLAIMVGLAPAEPVVLTELDKESLQNYCYRIHCEDQAQTHLHFGYGDSTPPPSDTPPSTPWDRFRKTPGQTFPTPEGKVLCAHCNGITHMYPDCGNCGGTGYV